MKIKDTIELLKSGKADKLLGQLYGENAVQENAVRYEALLKGYAAAFGENEDVLLFSSPGRTEISGNHTVHNHGKVLAGSINLDCVGAAAKTNSNLVHIISETYNQDFTIDLNDLEPSPKKAGTIDLVKGLLKGFLQLQYNYQNHKITMNPI